MRRLFFTVLVLVSCGGELQHDPCETASIDDFKELMIVDPAITSDARAENATDGPWSFRHVIEALAPANEDPGDFVHAWFLEWVGTTSFNGYSLLSNDETPDARAKTMQQEILCPWMKRSADDCNLDCSVCTTTKLDLAQAPFRLLAVVNRMDLADQPDVGGAGEGRLVFALSDGAGDDPSAAPMQMTMSFDFRLAGSRAEWGAAWHALGSHASFDDAYATALEGVTNGFITQSAFSEALTNESALFWIWQERQFELGADGGMHVAGTRNTPPDQLNGSQVIADYIEKNSPAILAGKYVVPANLLGGAADVALVRWDFPGVTEQARQAFSTGTCSGCHTQEQANLGDAFHISPFHDGVDGLSRYLYDPADRATDQLTVREASLRAALCSE